MEFTRLVKAFSKNKIARPNRFLRKVCKAQIKQMTHRTAVKKPKTLRSISLNPFSYKS